MELASFSWSIYSLEMASVFFLKAREAIGSDLLRKLLWENELPVWIECVSEVIKSKFYVLGIFI